MIYVILCTEVCELTFESLNCSYTCSTSYIVLHLGIELGKQMINDLGIIGA